MNNRSTILITGVLAVVAAAAVFLVAVPRRGRENAAPAALPTRVLPADTYVYLEVPHYARWADRVDGLLGAAARKFPSLPVYGRYLEIVRAFTGGLRRVHAEVVGACVDPTEFVYLPGFMVLAAVPPSAAADLVKGVASHCRKGMNLPVVDATSGRWRGVKVELASGARVWVMAMEGVVVLSGSDRMFHDVVSVCSGKKKSMEGDPRMAAALADVRAAGGELRVVVRSRKIFAKDSKPYALISSVLGKSAAWVIGKATEYLASATISTAAVHPGNPLLVDGTVRNVKEKEPITRMYDVKPAVFKFPRYVYPRLFFVYGWRLDFPAFWASIEAENPNEVDEYRKEFAAFKKTFGLDLKKDVFPNLGPEVVVCFGHEDYSADGIKPLHAYPSFVFMLQVNRQKKKVLAETLDRAVAIMMDEMRRVHPHTRNRNKPFPYVTGTETYKGYKIRKIYLHPTANYMGPNIKPAYTFVGDFFVFTSYKPALCRIIDAYEAGGVMGKTFPFDKVMGDLTSKPFNYLAYFDVHLCAMMVEALGVDYIKTHRKLDASRKKLYLSRLRTALQVARRFRAYATATVRTGDVHQKKIRILLDQKPVAAASVKK